HCRLRVAPGQQLAGEPAPEALELPIIAPLVCQIKRQMGSQASDEVALDFSLLRLGAKIPKRSLVSSAALGYLALISIEDRQFRNTQRQTRRREIRLARERLLPPALGGSTQALLPKHAPDAVVRLGIVGL